MKGLTDKFTYYPRDPKDQRELGGYKADYAFDAEGRLWRRVYTEDARGYRRWTKRTPWHIADPYQWFPLADLTPPNGARKSNSQARLPNHERYIIKGERIETPR